jgi:phytol kinase
LTVNPILGIIFVLAILGGLMGGLRLYQTLAAPHPELVRKLLHIGMGLTTLSLPWLFDTAWPVLVLAGLSIVALGALRILSNFRAGLGNVLSAVARSSLGEIYFPMAVTALFLLYLYVDPENPARLMLYCIPILLLTLADAAAALIGISYGRLHYETADGQKSAEGSLAFFTCAFLVVHIPLLLFTDTPRAETLLIAVLLAWLAMMFEAIAWRGLDNLVLPLVCYLLLRIYLNLSVDELLARLGITSALVIFLLFYRYQTTLVGSGVLAAFLAGYIAWALGGWHWLLPPLVLFLTYTLLSPRTDVNARRVHNVHAVASVMSAGLTWLFLATLLHRPELLFPYTVAFAANLSIIGIARLRYDYPKWSAAALLAVCIVQGWALLFVPYLIAEGISRQTAFNTLVGLVCVSVAALAFYMTQPGIDNCPTDTPRWVRQATYAGVGSLVGLVPLYLF